MPELPEVETIKNDLKEKILDKKIIKITCRKRKIVKNNFNFFLNTLIGNKFSNIKRIGKLLIFEINRENLYLLIHLKMTGQLVYCPSRGIVAGGHSYPEQKNTVESAAEAMCLPNKYSHVIFNFADGSNLFFNDMRQFGYFKTVRKDELEIIKKNFGIEPLASNFKLNNFKRIFIKRKAPVKALLLNQKLIAGIGNIYADEILFSAKIKPDRRADSLTGGDMEKIFKAGKLIIKKAIKHRGTTFNNYIDASGRKGNYSRLLKVYKREGEQCLICKNIIKKIKVAGRGTRYCPKCQK